MINAHIKNWGLFYLTMAIVFLTVFLGLESQRIVGGCSTSICNELRGFQWESVAAGLLGLAGGMSVIAATNKQMEQARELAELEAQRFLLADTDRYLVDIFEFEAECERYSKQVLIHLNLNNNSPAFDETRQQSTEESEAQLAKICAHLGPELEFRENSPLMAEFVKRAQSIQVPFSLLRSFSELRTSAALLLVTMTEDAELQKTVGKSYIPDVLKRFEKAREGLDKDVREYRENMIDMRQR